MPGTEDSLLQFPCEFPIKAIGRADPQLDALVFSLIRPHAPDLGEAAIRTARSAHGRYVSVTVTVRATSRGQLDAIYRDLSACRQILLVL